LPRRKPIPRNARNEKARVRPVPKTWRSRDFDNLTPRQRGIYTRAIEVLGTVRRGKSLSEGANDLGITPATVLRYFPHDFSKAKGSRRWVANKSDRHVRLVRDIGPDGMTRIRVRGSREASQQSLFLNDVRKAITKNDPTIIARWDNKRIGGRKLMTSFRRLMALAQSGDLSFEDLYSVGAE
jgi:hypothetical protein